MSAGAANQRLVELVAAVVSATRNSSAAASRNASPEKQRLLVAGRERARNGLAAEIRARAVVHLRQLEVAHDVADDLAQQCALRLVDHLVTHADEIAAPDAYVRTTARHALFSLGRSKTSREIAVGPDALDPKVEADRKAKEDADATEFAEQRAAKVAAMRAALADPRMPAAYREVLQAVYLDDPPTPIAELAHAELEHRRGTSSGLSLDFDDVRNTIDARLKRARAWVRKKVEDAKSGERA